MFADVVYLFEDPFEDPLDPFDEQHEALFDPLFDPGASSAIVNTSLVTFP
jgi:hypothetical protein